ncbi:MAG: hypothetical protein J5959_08725, partial [Butyrivibrio sp.]|nr:hypothetical protein [Butyrivibrio sp.]
MGKKFHDAGISGIIPTGLPGGFFIYEANDVESVLYAGPNVLEMYGCENMGEFIQLTGGTFKGMVHPDDYKRIENQIQAQTIFGEKKHDYVRY